MEGFKFCLFIFLYLFALGIFGTIIGLSWNKLNYKLKFLSQILLFFNYVINLLIIIYVFEVEFIAQLCVSCYYLIVIYFSMHLQIVGLTGGISCGKTTVSKILKENNAFIINLDSITKDLLRKKVLQDQICKAFNKKYFDSNQKFDKQELSKDIFNNREMRKKLNKIMHPKIAWEALKQIFVAKILKNERLVVLETALLFETPFLSHLFFPIICVYVDDSNVLMKRLIERDQISENEAWKKIKAQMNISVKKAKSHILIDNTKNEQYLEEKIFMKVLPVLYDIFGMI